MKPPRVSDPETQFAVDDIYRQLEELRQQSVKNGQTTDVSLNNLILVGNTRGHKFRVNIDDNNPTSPVLNLIDVGRK